MISFLDCLNNLAENVKLCDEDNNCNVVTDKFDFTKKSDLDRLKESVKSLKDDNNPIIGMLRIFAGEEYDKTLDSIVSEAQKIYDDSNNKKIEIDKSVMGNCEQKSTPTRPSEKSPEEIKKQICKITVEYLNSVIIPNYKNMTSEQAESVYNALFEFACWIYNR